MADEKLGIGSEENKSPEVSVPPGADVPPTQQQAVVSGIENEPDLHPASG